MELNNFDQILFIGAGGTNGYLIPNVLRLLAFSSHSPSVMIFDPDEVGPENIFRQNFSPYDVGKNKAKVMAERYGTIYNNIKVSYMPAAFSASTPLRGGLNRLIIDAVDKLAPRVVIDDIIKRLSIASAWLSLGNSNKDGQMVFYHSRLEGRRTVVDIFPESFTEEKLQEERDLEEAISCGEQVVVEPQSLAINLMGAMIATNALYELFYENTISNDIVIYDRYNSIMNYKPGAPLVEDVDNTDLADLLSEQAAMTTGS